MLTYDQTSEIRYAFEEAFIEAGRRRALRVRHRVEVQLHPWKNGQLAEPINVTVEDFSAYGIGVLYTQALELGTHLMLKVPRREQEDLQVLFTVVRRCQVDPASHSLGLEATAVLKPGCENQCDHLRTDKYLSTLCSRRVKLLFIAFGIVSLAVALNLDVL